jgi:UDP-glucose 6-dehydrogenase
MNLKIPGTGYVGLSSLIFLIQSYPIIAIDIDPNKFDNSYNKISCVVDEFLLFQKLLKFLDLK